MRGWEAITRRIGDDLADLAGPRSLHHTGGPTACPASDSPGPGPTRGRQALALARAVQDGDPSVHLVENRARQGLLDINPMNLTTTRPSSWPVGCARKWRDCSERAHNRRALWTMRRKFARSTSCEYSRVEGRLEASGYPRGPSPTTVAAHAHPQECIRGTSEQMAGRQPDARLLEDVGAGAARIAFAFERKERIHAAARLRRQHDARYPWRACHRRGRGRS